MKKVAKTIAPAMRTRWPWYLAAVLLANLLGSALVFSFVSFTLPISESQMFVGERFPALVAFGIYLALAGIVAIAAAAVMLQPVVRWYVRGGPPQKSEQLAALRAPLRQTVVLAILWAAGGVLFTFLTAGQTPSLAVAISISVLLSASATCCFSYMLAERILRPVAARALSEGNFAETMAPGVYVRMFLTWGLGTCVPVVGIILLCISQLTTDLVASANALAVSVLLLSIMTIVAAFALSFLTASHISDPIRQLRKAFERVQQGDTDFTVDVYDGSEVGLLQVGFNRMVKDVSERTKLRELFGQHVGEDVARRALEYGTELGGETRHVAVLFVDMVGSTGLATQQPPGQVVKLLNEFFRIVVGVVDMHGGFVNKFVGDEALVIFGAPLYRPDAPTAALAAARDLRVALEALPEIDVGIGVSAGLAVAGNIGAAERFEYTVIGDPVNEAARLTELAKNRPERVLASSSALYFATEEEQAHWELAEHVQLRGRKRSTRLAVPVAPPGPGT